MTLVAALLLSALAMTVIVAVRYLAVSAGFAALTRARFPSLYAGQARQITAGFGMACTVQYPARLCHQGENMPWLHNICGLGPWRYRRLYCPGTFSR